MTTPIESLSHLVVGSVESVAPDKIGVLLELDAPSTTALNTGTPTAFPRLNSYVLIPNEAGATVAYVAWMGIERSAYPKRAGFKDFGLVDLPFPLRKMSVVPVGTLASTRAANRKPMFELSRGVVAFPSVGDQVLMPTPQQVEAIVGMSNDSQRVRLGSSPMASRAVIAVDPDRLFGRHLAVLGNTGSGKSCTVAGLIRWSLEAARTTIQREGREGAPNARFIVLDPNGEYAHAFRDEPGQTRVFRVPPVSAGERALQVPAWLWNGHEWAAVAQAQPGAQRPLLLQGIRELKSGNSAGVPRDALIRRYLTSYATRLSALLSSGTQGFAGGARARFECARMLEAIAADCVQFSSELSEPAASQLAAAADATTGVVDSRRSGQWFNDFSVTDLESVRASLTSVAETLPDLGTFAPINEDAPTQFDVNLLAEHLEKVATEQGGNLAGFISTLGLRIRGMLADHRLGQVIAGEPPVEFDAWLNDYIGRNGADGGSLAIIDLSLVPSEIVHVVVAVLARLVFEASQRYRRHHVSGMPLPSVLVLEEAHTFVRRGKDDDGPAATPARLCREAFERIAREGRKFGLGLVLSSQRPSELSPTVLAQCNTFLLHRIVNDSDQELVARLVPDNVGGLLRELPSLPSRQAILLGWATPIPILVDIDELPVEQRPQSSDPDFWDVWTLGKERSIDWGAISTQWVGAKVAPSDSTPEEAGGT
jgi:uncharacterized protein